MLSRFWNDFDLLYEACFPRVINTMNDGHHHPHPHPSVHHPARHNLLELGRLLTKYNYNDSDNYKHKHYAYGTAGFRYPHAELPAVLLRVGVAAALLTAGAGGGGGGTGGSNNGGHGIHHHVGVMVTASHNAEDYNGVKLAGIDGGMIGAPAEALTVHVVNERSLETLLQFVEAKLREHDHGNTPQQQQQPQQQLAVVHLGRDTRSHSPQLACLVRQGAASAGCTVVDHGVVTTPQLHHCVRHANAAAGFSKMPIAIPVRLNCAGYSELLAQSYAALLATKEQQQAEPSRRQRRQRRLVVDCACGVGYPHLREIVRRLRNSMSNTSNATTTTTTIIHPTNPPGAGPLNEACGSEFVQKEQKPCKWYSVGDNGDGDDDTNGNGSGEYFAAGDDVDTSYCAALDGDADRIVFFSCSSSSDSDESFTLLDGDQMACLIANFLRDQLQTVLREINSNSNNHHAQLQAPKLGVVQTAYANGASTEYLRRQGVDVAVARTGVKHVHQVAHDRFDIGVYFEANGHGTVLFNSAYYDFLIAADRLVATHTPACTALQRLKLLPCLVNQAVGDALSDLLLVDAILQLRHWTLADWSAAQYRDWPSRQLKVRVADRTAVRTNGDETRCVAPAGVQPALDAAAARAGDRGRAFVRPSGTEDAVRVYAEAATAEQADALAARAAEIVFRQCGGVGEAPPARESKL